MRWCAVGLMACFAISAQTPADLYRAHCAACHGPAGEGSRGPSLRVPALRANDAGSLAALLRRGIPGTEMTGLASTVVPDPQLGALAGYVLGMRTNPTAAASGRAGRGAELFRNKGKCLDCHRLNGEGRASGPDLAGIGDRRDAGWLRRAVVEPEAEIFDNFSGYRWTIPIPDNYLLVEIVTKAGERITGGRINEDAFSIQVRDGEGRIRSLLKREVAELHKRWGKSPMPSYAGVFSSGEIDDLVAYLSSLR